MAKVLVVEDNPINMTLAIFLLESAGHTVLSVTDAETGLRLARQEQPDLILMDIQLPGMDGLEATALLKADDATRAIPVIALTALAMKGDEERIRAAGCDGYIAEPMAYQEFLATISGHLAPAAEAAPADLDAPFEGGIADRPARILIVDDEPYNSQLLEGVLVPLAYDVVVAATGEEAIAMVERHPPDLILLDVMMPGMDGYEVARSIKGDIATRHIPIIMVTSLDDRSTRMRGLEAGAEDFLTKPVDRAELIVRTSNLLRLKAYGDRQVEYSEALEVQARTDANNLDESESLYRSTFDAAPVGIAHVGRDGRWLRVNRRLCSLLEYSCEQLLSTAAPRLLGSEAADGEMESFERMAAGTLDHYVIDEKRYRRGDNSCMLARVNMSVHRDAAGEFRHFILVVEDITDLRMLEAQARQTSKMEAIGQLASGVAHDFNNILTVILGFAELMEQSKGKPDAPNEDLGEIIKAAQRAMGLTKQLLAFGRQQVLGAVPVDVNELVRHMSGMLDMLIGKDIDIKLVLAPDLWSALIDPGQLEQVVMNLVVNARDAMPDGGSVILETANVELENSYFHDEAITPGPYVMFAVTDTGTGMTKETRRRVFEPFFTTKESGKGTGLGLSTTYGIVAQSKGYIWVYSELDLGTTFKVYVPCSGCDSVVGPGLSAPLPDRTTPGTVLLVEDEAGVRQFARRILDRAGYRVLEAVNGDEGEALFRQHSAAIDLVVTDIIMPGCSGLDLVQRLRAHSPELRVLYMSGFPGMSTPNTTKVDLTFPFIQKPFTSAEFRGQVRQALDRKRNGLAT